MFYGLGNIIEIDLSSFDFSQVTSMRSMFRECTSLTSIKFGNIVTSQVKDMYYTFQSCLNLESIDLSKFDTSSVTTFEAVLSHCEKIKSIDASSFTATNAECLYDMFSYDYKLISINLCNFDTSKVKNMQGVFFADSQLKYINLQLFRDPLVDNNAYFCTSCSNLLYFNLRSYITTNTNNIDYNNFISPSLNTKYCIEDQNTINKVIGDKTNDCSDLCFQENVIFDINEGKCICNENYKFEYNNNCYHECPDSPLITYPIFTTKYICSPERPENYYYDNIDNVYKECYSTCKICSQSGDNDNNNCQQCKENYRFIVDPLSIENNCYSECSDYSYFIGINQYYCTPSCYIDGFKKKIESKKKCIDECKNDDEYIYELNNECYKDCPGNTIAYVEGYKCVESCTEQQFIYNNKCYDECPMNTNKAFNIRKICLDTIPTNYYLDNNDNIYKECYSTCKTCSQSGTDTNHNCNSCKNEFIYKYNNNCFDKCPENLKTFEEDKICLDGCRNKQFEYNDICYTDCPKGKYKLFENRNKCVDSIPEYYYYLDNDNIYKKCYEKCKKCSQLGDEDNNKCIECIDGYLFITDSLSISQNCYRECQFNYYFTGFNKYECTQSNECPPSFNKLISSKKKCIDDCKKDDEYIYKYQNNCLFDCQENTKKYEEEKLCLDECYPYQFEYNNICYNNCPDNLKKILTDRNRCIDIVPEGYFLDSDDNIYKKCFDRCKICSQVGNEVNNNCDECNDNYLFLNDSFANSKNCYEKCEDFYYFDENNKYSCIESCPSGFEKIISQRKKCIDDCTKDDYYIYEYDKQCLSKCPDNLKIDEETKQCLEACYSKQFEFENICYYTLPEDNSKFFKDGNIYINNLEDFEEILYNIIFPEYTPEDGNKVLIERPDNKVYQITNSINELDLLQKKSDNIWGLSIIDLGQCEILLKTKNNININDSLIYIKNEIKSNKVSERNAKIEVYNPYNKKKLNLSICEEAPVNIYFPMELSKETKQLYDKMKNSGYDMFNIKDPFYQDICTPFDSSNGTDILLIDRIDYIYYNEDTNVNQIVCLLNII